jgi:hypothetical protein
MIEWISKKFTSFPPPRVNSSTFLGDSATGSKGWLGLLKIPNHEIKLFHQSAYISAVLVPLVDVPCNMTILGMS